MRAIAGGFHDDAKRSENRRQRSLCIDLASARSAIRSPPSPRIRAARLLADLDRPAAGQIEADLPSSAEAARAVFRLPGRAAGPAKTRAARQEEAEPTTARPLTQAGAMSRVPRQRTPADAAPQQPQPAAAAAATPSQTRRKRASMPRPAPISALSSGWCGSGRTISAFPPTRSSAWPGPMSARRSARMCSAASPICCKRSRAIRRCCSISTMSNRWAPNSVAGINRDKGLNENLARETLELHTLGVRTGYTQTDVTSFAKVLTGWTWIPPSEPDMAASSSSTSACTSRARRPCSARAIPTAGMDQGRAVLADLARHPATAQHIAQKLAAHFIADEPPPPLVAKLAKSFQRTATAISKKSPRP